MADQAASLRDMVGQTNKYAKVVTFASGKGGVGKSNIIINMAIVLAGRNCRVAVLDMDLGLANLDILLGLTPHFNLTHVMSGHKKMTEIILPGPNDIMFIPGASGVSRLANLSRDERTYLINSFADLESMADIILVDTGAGLGDNVLHFALSSQAMVVVTTPEPTARMDAYALIKTSHRLSDGEVPIQVLVNEVRSENEANQVFNSLSSVCKKHLKVSPDYLGHLPYDLMIPNAVKKRRPFILQSPHCPAARPLNHLADNFQKKFLSSFPQPNVAPRQSFFEKVLALVQKKVGR